MTSTATSTHSTPCSPIRAPRTPTLRQTAYDGARAGARILEAGWPDERSVRGALVDPIEPIVLTRIFEELATR